MPLAALDSPCCGTGRLGALALCFYCTVQVFFVGGCVEAICRPFLYGTAVAQILLHSEIRTT